MGWRDLLQTEDETFVSPWVGGRSLRSFDRFWRIEGKLPQEHGWHGFRLAGRKARWTGPADQSGELRDRLRGYLVADRLVPDEARVETDPIKLAQGFERVHLIEPGLDRFVRIVAGRSFENGPLIYDSQEFPLGPEDEVLQAYFDEAKSVDHVSGVAPALDAAFRFESWHREEIRRRREEERKRREEEERKRQLEARRQEIIETLGDAAGRRELARYDFAEAARAALAVGGAQYLDSRPSYNKGEMVVRYRMNGRGLECTCDAQTLRIIDSGCCLTNHATGEQTDTRFTLESLPGVIQEADRRNILVVYRHVD
jgi:hypothetical protein